MPGTQPYILAETNWHALKNQSFELAILPWGATEAHNYHLPYSTDNIESERIAAEAARLAWEKGARVIVLPTLPFGVNTGQRDIYLDISLNPSTLMAILSDIVDGLHHQGILKLLILNSHGGNDFKPILRELGLRYPGMFLSLANWYQIPGKEKYYEQAGDHAGEMETSLMLYLRPDLVLPKEDWGEGREKQNRIRAFREGWAWTERKWPLVTEDTGVGNPRPATREKGEKHFLDLTAAVAELIVEICDTNPGEMYE
ncbi:MAG: creatininase family protein [Bacteroides sp.]|nr:creatininase family protein [Bacteroides sp.]